MKAHVLSTLMALGMAALLALSLLAINFSSSASSSNNVIASVAVGNVIYLSISPNAVSFGSVYPKGTEYLTNTNNANTVDTDNGGNIGANVLIEGGGFSFGSNSIGVSNTFWASTAGIAGTPLASTFTPTNIIILQPSLSSPSTSNTIYFGVTIPVNTPPGNYVETITFENENVSSSTFNALSTAYTVTASANVQSVCYISLSPTAINFGQIYAGANSIYTSNSIGDTNGGNVPANILTDGTNWAGPNTIGVSNTVWDAADVLYGSGTPLTTSPVQTNIYVPAQASNSIFYGLGVPGGTPAGAYTQTITIENSC